MGEINKMEYSIKAQEAQRDKKQYQPNHHSDDEIEQM